MHYEIGFLNTWGHQMWYVEFFEGLNNCINFYFNLLCKNYLVAKIVKNRLKVGFKTSICKFHSHFTFWTSLGMI